jgi:hypothetical protein
MMRWQYNFLEDTFTEDTRKLRDFLEDHRQKSLNVYFSENHSWNDSIVANCVCIAKSIDGLPMLSDGKSGVYVVDFEKSEIRYDPMRSPPAMHRDCFQYTPSLFDQYVCNDTLEDMLKELALPIKR